ncbi:general nucleoside transport system permease protein [Desulfovibrionales bacterium]
MNMDLILITLSGILTAGTPLLMAALGETIAERAGIVNLSLDGTILLAAMVAFVTASVTSNIWLGLVAGAAIGILAAAVLAVTSLWFGCSQFAIGFILTLFYRDLAYFLGQPWNRQPGPQMTAFSFLREVPGIGPLLSHLNVVTMIGFGLLGFVWWWLGRTNHGIVLRGVGENLKAAYSRGVDVLKVKCFALLAGGALVGLAGATFSLATKPGWGVPQGIEGSGWIALAIVIFGGWKPLRVAFGAYLFSTISVLGIYLQDLLPGVPMQIFQVASFPVMIFTMLAMNLVETRSFKTLAQRHPLYKTFIDAARVRPPAAMGAQFNPKDVF